jgi:hypothetical protein
MRSLGLAILCLFAPLTLSAQTVLRTEPPLDSARSGLRDVLAILRDSLLAVNGAAVRLQRDVRQASNASLLSRAGVMRDACTGSGPALGVARGEVNGIRLSQADRAKSRGELVKALNRLDVALTRCETQFAAMSQEGQAETVRGYAYNRSLRIQRAMQDYEVALRRFLDLMGIQLPTPKQSPGTMAG